FVTYGFFRTASQRCPWSAAVVQDWMLNSNFGIFAENPTLSQLRGQVGYAVSGWDEIGLWGTVRCLNDTRLVPDVGPVTWRPINQLNAYWHHKWEFGADTSLWFGIPERDRLSDGGSLGDYLAGAAANVPLNDYVALYTLITYMHPSAGAGPLASEEEFWNFTIGLAFYPG